MTPTWFVGEFDPIPPRLSVRGLVLLVLIGVLAVVVGCGGGIPGEPPAPPEPPWAPPEDQQCHLVGAHCACYAQPPEVGWVWVCCVKDEEGNLIAVENPEDCPEPPAPEPPSSTVCGEPTPPPLSHFRGPAEKGCRPGVLDATGKKWVDKGEWCDATPYVCGQAYCAEIGFTDGRRCCAVRIEGTPDRSACELEVCGGRVIWSADGYDLEIKGGPVEGNPFLAKCIERVGDSRKCTYIEVCNLAETIRNRKVY